ncbi:MAG TPA: glycosyltransferase family 4 protein, partial [bacterium]|nr:glycosyltransferase family 4 protein [bacterium]
PYRVFVGSRATARALRPLDGRRRLSVVNEGLDVARFHRDSRRLARDAARARLGVGAGEVVLLALGTVCPRKGQRDLLGALERMPPALWPRLRCFVVGGRDNPYNRDLLKRAGRLPDGLRGRFHVVEETLETGPYWAAADVFVHCSRAESWSRVVLEAMAMGLPIVATPAPGVPEQARENENALFYPDGDAPALARLLARLLEDPAERGRLAAASPVVLAGLRDLDEMARVYADALFEALLSV